MLPSSVSIGARPPLAQDADRRKNNCSVVRSARRLPSRFEAFGREIFRAMVPLQIAPGPVEQLGADLERATHWFRKGAARPGRSGGVESTSPKKRDEVLVADRTD